ncbi:MAG TPA: hypothetical protein VEL28_03630, partial [Candidatus Binatia bacterium]|nr:hypothetical protein [Candidatus Binatia bacterium]
MSPVDPTVSSLPLGRRIVTSQPGWLDCDAVPPGHCAAVKAPPVLLWMVKVKSTVPQQTPFPVHRKRRLLRDRR